ncbi:hypothetical protein BDZ90DRAFT_234497 [Jaminaea rosea]|uniref:Uncharacterized protein n=1 Tax=Jaminaea rosea TaxID=1569628 RepID=A0A316UHV8_9BASI|nr:hypothetical protein BDZ90DRAFT_234497 [Jaminaea rosea]PWN24876.1 hypothetical protein BDZ90DRAFT_234497 [Jaminaea rosea]
MAAPTAIPNANHSSHHQHEQQAPPPNRNSPPAFSPIYTRTAFSLPGGPMSPTSSFRNTSSGWTTAGAGVNGLKSSTNTPAAVQSHQRVQRDYFPDRDSSAVDGGAVESASMPHPRHHRAFSASSASSISSIDSAGPPTPGPNSAGGAQAGSGAPLGRVPSIGLGTSYEQFKNKRDTWAGGYNHGAGWAGIGGLRSGNGPGGGGGGGGGEPQSPPASGGGMGGLLRKLSLSSGAGNAGGRPHMGHHHGHRSISVSSTPAGQQPPTPNSDAATSPNTSPTPGSPPKGGARGRQNSVGGNQKRKPSPHGERLLMGWTHAH